MSHVTDLCHAAVSRLSRRQKRRILLGLDAVAVMVAVGLLAMAQELSVSPPALMALGICTMGCSAALGLHRIKLNAYETDGILRSVGMAMGVAACLAAQTWVGAARASETAIVLFGLIFLLIAVGSRALLLHAFLALLRHGKPFVPVVIYGAGDTGLQLAAALRRHDTILPVAFVDDNVALHGMTLAGLYVHAPGKLADIARQRDVRRVVLAMPALSPPLQAQLARQLQALGLEVQTVPSFAQLIGQEMPLDCLTPVMPGTFLGRDPVEPALAGGQRAYAGQTVLVTGAGGSIGSELCRQLLACVPARLILFDVSEAALYTIDKDLRGLGPTQTDIIPVLGSVTDARLVRATLAEYAVGVVFHSAAYKHVPLVERNPVVGIDNNVLGTQIIALAAEAAGVARFILISTDKAVRPQNVMGATKRLAELVVQDIGKRARTTRFSIVRFGNVLGSSGSVIPLFREQIARGGPVTLTHDDVTRYFMTVAEAARLLLTAAAFGQGQGARAGADVFVLDMGRPIRIRDLALQMIAAAGYRPRDTAHPDGDIEIATIGLRPGEKLHEELLIGRTLLPTPHPKILHAEEAALSQFEMAQALRLLRAAVAANDPAAARCLVFRWVEATVPARSLAEA